MRRRRKIIKDKKLRGEWVESFFVVCAKEHDLPVSKPWGEMDSYDFVVGKTSRFASVQVKSTTMVLKTGYVCTIRGGHKAYAPGSFNFLAVYVVPKDVWYIIPARLVQGKEAIALYPHSKTAKYEPYREAWHLLREAAGLDNEENQTAEQPVVTQPTATLPNSALARVQASMNYVRRYMEGNYPRPKQDEDV